MIIIINFINLLCYSCLQMQSNWGYLQNTKAMITIKNLRRYLQLCFSLFYLIHESNEAIETCCLPWSPYCMVRKLRQILMAWLISFSPNPRAPPVTQRACSQATEQRFITGSFPHNNQNNNWQNKWLKSVSEKSCSWLFWQVW